MSTVTDMKSLAGETLENKYKLSGRLGSGNFGAVYLAEELNNSLVVREVALKLYSPEATANGNIEGMFEDCALPAKILASAGRDDIKRHFVQIYSWGKINTPVGECAYVSMELVRDAVTLEDLTERHNRANHRPSAKEVLECMKQFFTGLAEAHKSDVLHRDIKGANVMLSNGIVKIVDFGMGARISAGTVPLKTTLSIYAPENFDGQYYPSSDVFQAGLMFNKYWTGIQPFEKNIARQANESDDEYNTRVMQELQVMHIGWHCAFPVQEKSPDAAKLTAILTKCLHFSYKKRYANAMEALLDLNRDTGSIGVAWEAFENKEYSFAENAAIIALQDPRLDEREKAEWLFLLGDISAAAGDIKSARDYYLEAYKMAEKTGAYFFNKPRMRELLTKLADCYRDLEQKGLERLYRSKIDKYK